MGWGLGARIWGAQVWWRRGLALGLEFRLAVLGFSVLRVKESFR